MNESNLFKFEAHAITHPGNVRTINEDACISRDNIGLWAVADGMGGHSAGDLASHKVVTALNQVQAPTSLRSFVDDVENQLINCNSELRTIAISEMDNNTVGSTLASLLIYQNYCAYMWVGDSRIYRLRSNSLNQLSRDHSQVEELIEQGVLLRENAESHPDANVITRAIGADEDLYVDINVDEVKIDDTFLICSDGLSKHVSPKEIELVLSKGSAIEMCTKLIQLTLERGATDNVTVSIIKILTK